MYLCFWSSHFTIRSANLFVRICNARYACRNVRAQLTDTQCTCLTHVCVC